jgi:hypothetical protein
MNDKMTHLLCEQYEPKGPSDPCSYLYYQGYCGVNPAKDAHFVDRPELATCRMCVANHRECLIAEVEAEVDKLKRLVGELLDVMSNSN